MFIENVASTRIKTHIYYVVSPAGSECHTFILLLLHVNLMTTLLITCAV